jgi:exosortase/archaeosortase family protein
MIKTLLKKVISNKNLIEPVAFLLKVALVYAFWRLLKYTGETYPGFLWGGWAKFHDVLGNLLASSNSFLLNLLGVKHLHINREIFVEGAANAIYFGDLCLGIAPMFIFSGIILAFGDNHTDKLWFIPMGVFFIYLINVFRLLALLLIHARLYSYFDFAHDYLYMVVTYGLIFLLVMWWMNRLAFKTSAATGSSS